MDTADYLDIASFNLDRNEATFVMPWPQVGNPNAVLTFRRFEEWQFFIGACALHPAIPSIVGDKFRRAQRLYLLSWIDTGLVKAGELVALTALELALKDRYGVLFRQRNASTGNRRKKEQQPSLHDLLEHMVDGDGLTDALLPFTRCYGGSIIPVLRGRRIPGPGSSTPDASRPTLAAIRNSLAHGDPFDVLPWSGLLELVRDLIEYAYRSYLQEAQAAASVTDRQQASVSDQVRNVDRFHPEQ